MLIMKYTCSDVIWGAWWLHTAYSIGMKPQVLDPIYFLSDILFYHQLLMIFDQNTCQDHHIFLDFQEEWMHRRCSWRWYWRTNTFLSPNVRNIVLKSHHWVDREEMWGKCIEQIISGHSQGAALMAQLLSL